MVQLTVINPVPVRGECFKGVFNEVSIIFVCVFWFQTNNYIVHDLLKFLYLLLVVSHNPEELNSDPTNPWILWYLEDI